MWLYYSLFFAIWTAFQFFLVKKLARKINHLVLLYIFFVFNIPITFILVLFLGGIPSTTNEFYLFMGIAGLLDALAFMFSYLAISISSISLISPVAAFGPVFTTLIAAFTLGETPTPFKFLGILLVVIGAYLLNVADIKGGIVMPFKKLFTHKGVLFFLVANLIWSITPIFQKKAIFETNPQVPIFASFVGMCFVLVFLTPFTLKKSLGFIKEIKENISWFVVNGVGTAFSQAAAYAAFALVYVGYASSVFKLSTLFVIIIGGVFLKEERVKERLLGGSVMVLGTVLLAL